MISHNLLHQTFILLIKIKRSFNNNIVESAVIVPTLSCNSKDFILHHIPKRRPQTFRTSVNSSGRRVQLNVSRLVKIAATRDHILCHWNRRKIYDFTFIPWKAFITWYSNFISYQEWIQNFTDWSFCYGKLHENNWSEIGVHPPWPLESSNG